MIIPIALWRFPADPTPGCPAATPREAAHRRGGAGPGKPGQTGTNRGRLLPSPAAVPAGILRAAAHRSVLPVLPLRGVAGGLSVTARLPPILLGRNGAFLVSHPCFSRPSWVWMYGRRELLPEALVRGEEELSVLGKQQGLEGLQPQGLFGLCYASGSFDITP